ncbi:hypothetical protein [Prauserella shujinwangii]|nr:hypothetical protein [Prauserella shujinwangii]
MNEQLPLWRRALTAELCWLDEAGQPHVVASTPLVAGSVPCVALPYARAPEVAGIGTGTPVAFAVTDSRSLRRGGPGHAWYGTVTRTEDTEGDFFAVELLRQELTKYPPSRTFADSPLLCRENWWWLPRIVLRLARRAHAVELPARTSPHRHALLARERSGELALDVVDLPDGAQGTGGPAALPLRSLAGGALRGDGAQALAFGYDYSMPDMERWEPWSLRGPLLGDRLEVTDRAGAPGAELGPLTLLQRIRRQRTLSRACRRELAAAQNRS